MITVTERAKNKAIELMTKEGGAAEAFIRVGVEGGGCSGLSYKLDFDNTLKPEDKLFEDKGIKIVVDKKSFLSKTNRTFGAARNESFFSNFVQL